MPHLAAVRRQFSQEQPQKGRLPGSIRTDQADAIAAQDALRVVANDHPPGKRLRHVLGFEHQLPGALPVVDGDAHGSCLRPIGGPLRAQRHQRADAPFVAGPACLDALPQPRLLLQQLLVEPLELASLGIEGRLLLLQVVRIAARPRREAAAIELDDACGDRGEEGAVVGDEEDGARIALQVFLEPADGVDIEMVRGLVEQEQVRLGDQRAAEQRAATPAAGQLVHPALGGQRQARDDVLDLLLQPPAVAFLEPVLQLAQPLHVRRVVRLRHADGRLVILGDEGAELAETRRDFREDGAIAGRGNVLIETRDAQPGLAPDGAAVGRLIGRQHAQQAALAGAVAANQRKALAVLDLEVGFFEKGKVTEGEADFLQRQQGHGRQRTTCYVLRAGCNVRKARATSPRARATCSCRMCTCSTTRVLRARDPARGTGTSHVARMGTLHPAPSTWHVRATAARVRPRRRARGVVRSWRAMPPRQKSPVTTSQVSGTSPTASGRLCSSRSAPGFPPTAATC